MLKNKNVNVIAKDIHVILAKMDILFSPEGVIFVIRLAVFVWEKEYKYRNFTIQSLVGLLKEKFQIDLF